ncbi:phage portal protein [Streptococcus mitis]|mgnify:FL=1|uniref:phage portal protein n=1 Tax=Streptococcus mitis TaxID=28037 RepID=UPI0021B7F464|nr:phage portal protein [Streptococcus mitis]
MLSNWFKWLIRRLLIKNTTQNEILEIEIREHQNSEKVSTMKEAYNYYRNRTDIRNKKVDVDWRTNSRIELGLFKKLVDQKVGYLFSKQPTISLEGEKSQDFLDSVFDEDLLSTIKSLGKEAVMKGIAYGLPYYDENGRLRLFKIPSEQIIPFWKDERHLELSAFVRVYNQAVYESGVKKTKTFVEYYDEQGITDYIWTGSHLELNPLSKETKGNFYYVNADGTRIPYTWEKVPLIPFRYNEYEDGLLVQTKSLIDNIQLQMSTNADMLADMPKLIYVLKNYQGADLGEFMNNLNKFRSIKVSSDGGVDTLQADNDTSGVEADIERSRKFLYEAARAIDTQDDNLGNASGQALKWRYTDLDLDCNELENEFQKGIKQFLWFVEQYAANKGVAFDSSKFTYVFNRDIISNESEAIQDCVNSIGILDDLSIREQHPWYQPQIEERLKEQQEQGQDPYSETNFKKVDEDHDDREQEKDR